MPRPRPAPAAGHDDLLTLGRELVRLRRRCRRLRRDDWSTWSASVTETNALAHRIGRVQPVTIADLVVRYDALHWLMIEQDDVIMDAEARQAFVALGRALKLMTRTWPLSGA